MSRGIAALDKRDQAAVREWLRIEELARRCRPAPAVPWPLWLVLLASFVAGYMTRFL